MKDIDSMIPAFNVMDRALKIRQRAEEVAAEWREIDARYPRASTTPTPSYTFEELSVEHQQHILALRKEDRPTILQLYKESQRTCGVVRTPIGSYVRYVDPDAKGDREKELHNTVWRVDGRHGKMLVCNGISLEHRDFVDPFCMQPYKPEIGDYVQCESESWWLGKQYTQHATFWIGTREGRSRPYVGTIPCIGVRPNPIANGYTTVSAKCGFKGKIDFYRTIAGSGRIGELEGFTRGINVNPDHFKLIPNMGDPIHSYGNEMYHGETYGDETRAIEAFVRKLGEQGQKEVHLPHG